MELFCKNPLAYSRNKSAFGFFEHASFQLWNCCNFWVDTQPVMEASFQTRKKSFALRITFKSTSVGKQNPLWGKMDAWLNSRNISEDFGILCTPSFASISLKCEALSKKNTSIVSPSIIQESLQRWMEGRTSFELWPFYIIVLTQY